MKLNTKVSDVQFESTGSMETIDYELSTDNKALILKLLSQYSDPISSVVREITSNCFDSHEEAKRIPGMSDEELIAIGYGTEEAYQLLRERDKIQKKVDTYQARHTRAYEGDVEYKETEHLLKEFRKELTIKENALESVISSIEDDLDAIRDYFTDWEERDVEIERIRTSGYSEDDRLIFRDFGVGLSPLRVKVILTNYLTSTKDKTNDFIGAFGLGSKSPLAYSDSFEIKTVFMGTLYHFLIAKGEEGPKLDLMYTEETEADNGTEVIIDTKPQDSYDFRRAIQMQLAYFDNITYIGITSVENNYKIYRGNSFIYRQDSPHSQMHICLGKVAYPLNASALDLAWRDVRCSIGLYFDIGEIDVMWNRESIEYTDRTKTAIKAKIEEAKVELQELHDSQYANITTIKEYIEYWSNSKTGSNVLRLADDVYVTNAGSLIDLSKGIATYDKLDKFNYPFYPFRIHKHVRDGNVVSNSSIVDQHPYAHYAELPMYLVEDSYSSKKNRFINYQYDPDEFLLVKLKGDFKNDDWKSSANFISQLSSIVGAQIHKAAQEEEYEEVKRQIVSFMEESIELGKEEFKSYEDIEITEAFEEYEQELRQIRRKERKKKRKKGHGEDTIPVRHLVGNNYSSYQEEMKWRMHEEKIDDLTSHTGLIIYGHQDDDDKLLEWAPFLFTNKNLQGGKKKGWDYGTDHPAYTQEDDVYLDHSKAMVIKIAMSNAKYLEENGKAFHIDDFINAKPALIRRYITAINIRKNVNWELTTLTHEKIAKLDMATYESARFLSKYISQYANGNTSTYSSAISQELRDSLTDLFIKEKLLDYTAIKHYKRIMAFGAQYPLLQYTSLSQAPLEELIAYMSSKPNVRPELYHRYLKSKEENK